MPQPNQATVPDSSSAPLQSNVTEGNNTEAGPGSTNQMPGFPDGANYGPLSGMPVWAPHGMGPGGIVPTQEGPPQEEERRSVSRE